MAPIVALACALAPLALTGIAVLYWVWRDMRAAHRELVRGERS